MNLWKKIAIVLLGLPCAGLLGIYVWLQGLGDVRTEVARTEGATEAAQRRGRDLLARSLAAMGGVECWGQVREQAVSVTFQHDWHDPMLRSLFMPIEFSGQKMSLLLRPGHLDARLAFLDGDWRGRVWGNAGGRAYVATSDGDVSWAAGQDVAFHVPGYRYFFFLPFHLSEAEKITYAGPAELHGSTYELVYATWGQWQPHAGADQYLLWINQQTWLVDYVQSTVREMFPRSIVSCALGDYRETLGLRLPFSLRVLADIEDQGTGMHHMEVQAVERATKEAARQLRLDR